MPPPGGGMEISMNQQIHEITGHTRLGVLLGSPVEHSMSPIMYNTAFQLLGIDWVYLCFDTAHSDLSRAVQVLREMNVFGFNLTMPNKVLILPELDELSQAARLIGAVNTVQNLDGRLIGHNTDGIGFMRALSVHGYDKSAGAMTLLGAGGAASSIAIQAALDGVPVIHLVCRRGRTWPNAQHLMEQINKETSCRVDLIDFSDSDTLEAAIAGSSLLTNATSIGMSPDVGASPIPDPSILRPDLFVVDIIYEPKKTRLLAQSDSAGCPSMNGLDMLLYQGDAAFEIWTGRKMPVKEIRGKYFT